MVTKKNREFTIGEASDEIGLPESTIRYYDREFSDYLGIDRGKNNQRIFTEDNLKDLEYIRYLLKREDYSVEEVKEKLVSEIELRNREENDDNNRARTAEEKLDENDRYRELIEHFSEAFTCLEKRFDRLDDQLNSVAEKQEAIKRLLDMNLQRYNKLVEKIF